MRAVLGWLRGEPKHCSMAAIPTITEEDSRRSNREHQTLVQEQTRVVNRMKATLIALVFAPSTSSCARRATDSRRCTARKTSHCRRTRLPSCAATRRGSSSFSRFRRPKFEQGDLSLRITKVGALWCRLFRDCGGATDPCSPYISTKIIEPRETATGLAETVGGNWIVKEPPQHAYHDTAALDCK
jgi:hypothetical protein